MKTLTLFILIFFTSTAYADTDKYIWKNNELNESYMRSITKHDCMLKAVATLKLVCKSGQCIKTVGGVTGDCLEWSKGTRSEFCQDFETKYIQRYCVSGFLDPRRCELIQMSNKYYCSKNK